MIRIFFIAFFVNISNSSYSTPLKLLKTLVSEANNQNIIRYINQNEIKTFLHDLQQGYPNLVRIETIGQDIGRNITFVHISSGSSGKTTIFLDGNLYGRNWISPSISFYIISQLVENVENRKLIESINWTIYPDIDLKDFENTLEIQKNWLGKKKFFMEEICDGKLASCVDNDNFYLDNIKVLSNYLKETKNVEMYLTLHSLLCL